MRALLIILGASLAAGCANIIGIDDPVLSDHIIVTGSVVRHVKDMDGLQAPLTGIKVELVTNADGQPVLNVSDSTTDSSGGFNIEIPREYLPGDGLDAQVHIYDPSGAYMPVYLHPTTKIMNSGSYPNTELFTPGDLDTFASVVGVTNASAGRTLRIYVSADRGSGSEPAAGAVVTSTSGGSVRYVSDDGSLSTILQATGGAGQAFLLKLDQATYTPKATSSDGSATLDPPVTVQPAEIGIVELDLQ